MSEFVQGLNSAGNVFILFALRMLIQSSVLILSLWLLDLVLRRRVRAVVRYWIWLLILVKLVLPPSLSSPTSLISWIGGRLPEAATVVFVPEPPVAVRMVLEPPVTAFMPPEAASLPPATGAPPTREIPLPTTTVAPMVLPTWQAMMVLAWIAAVLIMLVLLVQRACFVLALTSQAQEAPEGLRALLESCRRHMGVRGAVAVRLSGLSASPSVCGLLRPVILVPAPMTRQLEARQLRSVLFHELAHIKRGDLWINLVQTLLQIAYLYHPLLWLANVHIRRIREQAVDESVLAALGEDAEDYPRTLLSISKLAFGQPALSLRLLGVVESKKALTARIRLIVSRPFPSSAKLGLAGLALVLTVGAMLLPMARAKNRASSADESARPSGPATLETLRQLVARNEALINPIKLDYTMRNVLPDEAQPASARGRASRPYSHLNLSWAQRGSKQYMKEDTFFGPNEPGRSTVTILDDSIRTEVQWPARMEASIQSRQSTDLSLTLPGMLEMRPSQGQQTLTELLVPDYAVLHSDTELVKGRPTYVIDVSRPLVFSMGMRIWLDREAGVPVRVQHLDRHPTVPQGQVSQEVNDVSLYRLPNGGWIPVAGVRTFRARLPLPHRRQSITVDVNSIRVGPEEVPESLFQIDLPPGAVVRDARSGITSIVGQPAKTYEQVVAGGGRFLAGTVVDAAGAPIQGVVAGAIAVAMLREDGQTNVRMLRPQPDATTDALGRFALEVPEEGTYDLLFRHPDFAYAALNGVPLGERGLKISLGTGGAITGRVVRMVNGQKVPAAHMEVQTFAPNTPTLRAGQIRATTDAEGRFEFKCLDTNRFRPRFGREQELAYNPISRRVFCGLTSTSVQFEKGVHVQEVELVLRPDPAMAPSLVGRELPAFEGLGVNLRAQDAQGKMVLVCFFDLNQRPARHYVEELAQKSQELRDKGVVVVAVQAAEVEADALATWRRDAQVSFPIGAIQEDLPERKYTWSVRSLPWLILTDRSHVVRAEGFDMGELQSKMEAVPSVGTLLPTEDRDPSPAAPATVPPVAEKAGGEISGVVLDSSGRPIAEAIVTLDNTGLLRSLPAANSGPTMHTEFYRGHAQTDSRGRFRVADLTLGSTGILVAAPGYRTEFLAHVSTGMEGLRIVLGEPRPYQLSGVVKDVSSQPPAFA